VNDKLERLTIANEVAAYLGVDAQSVLEQFRRAAASRRPPPAPSQPEIPAPERLLVRILLRNTQARDEVLPRITTANLATRRIIEAIAAATRAGQDLAFAAVDDRLDEAAKTLLHSLAFADDTDVDNLTVEQALACLEKLEPSDRELRRAGLRNRVRQLEREGRVEEALSLMKELSRLEREEN
jgi:hypothetical protein